VTRGLVRAAAALSTQVGAGAGASRPSSAASANTPQLEDAVADWLRRSGARLFNTGYARTSRAHRRCCARADVVYRRANHASIVGRPAAARASSSSCRTAIWAALEAALARAAGGGARRVGVAVLGWT